MVTTASPEFHPLSRSPEEQLRMAIYDIDALQNGAFNEISAIARLALTAMESPRTWQHPEPLWLAFEAIWSKAMDIQNTINAMAEHHGCGYSDQVRGRIYAAMRAGQQERTDHGG